MPTTVIHRLRQRSPDDITALETSVASGELDPSGIVAILGKTEGNGCVNDFTRAFAVQSLRLWLGRYLSASAVEQICLVMSGGTEGGLSPHLLVLERRETQVNGTTPALAVGVAHSAELPAEQLGRRGQVEQVAETVRSAMQAASIDDPDDVHFVQIKCPLLTAARIGAVQARGLSTATQDTLKSMGLSRGAAALGIAVALGELANSAISDELIGRDWRLYSRRASTSGGVELLNHEVVVLGMSRQWSGPLAVDHAVMQDAIDIEPVRAALARLGLTSQGQLSAAQQAQLVCLLAKAEASSSGQLRGRRHTMLDDSDISSTRHARGFVAGALAGLVGHAELFVSGGAEHQGPDGGGPVAVVVRRD